MNAYVKLNGIIKAISFQNFFSFIFLFYLGLWFQSSSIYAMDDAAGSNIDNRGTTPLHTAAGKGEYDIVQQLIEEGADINQRADAGGISGATPLHVAAANGRTEVVKLLIVKRADIDAVSSNKATPLYFAIAKGHPEVVKLLIDKGACVNATHLQLALDANKRSTAVVKLLKASLSVADYIDVAIHSKLPSREKNINHTDKSGHFSSIVLGVGGLVLISVVGLALYSNSRN